MGSRQPETLADIEQFAEDTAATTMYLSIQGLGINHLDVDHMASHLGRTIGITNLINTIPVQATYHTTPIPIELALQVSTFLNADLTASISSLLKMSCVDIPAKR